MFGGTQQSVGFYPLNDTWRYIYRSASVPPDRCIAGQDTDGDGLVDCADPDCWGWCMPSDPPATACDANQPHCGDGVCSLVEDYRACPQGCPQP